MFLFSVLKNNFAWKFEEILFALGAFFTLYMYECLIFIFIFIPFI